MQPRSEPQRGQRLIYALSTAFRAPHAWLAPRADHEAPGRVHRVGRAGVERLCDTAFEDCRQPLWDLIDHETVGIDVSFWFIQDTSLSNKLIARKLGDPTVVDISAGVAAGMISSLEPAGTIIRRIVEEAEQVLRDRTTALLG